MAALAACSSDDPEARTTTAPAPLETTWTVAGPAVTIPAEPGRVVLVDPDPATLAVARTQAADRVAGVVLPPTPPGVDGPDLGDRWALLTEPVTRAEVAALRPDLIVAPAGEPVGRLRGLAPIARLPRTNASDWQAATVRAGDLLGVGEETRARLAEVEARIAEVAGEVAPSTELTLLEVRPGGLYARPGAYPSALIAELGFEVPAAVATPPASGACCVRVPLDDLDKADADYVLVAVDRTDAARAEHARITDDPLWSALGASQRQDVHEVSAAAWTEPTLPGVETVLSDIETYVVSSQGVAAPAAEEDPS